MFKAAWSDFLVITVSNDFHLLTAAKSVSFSKTEIFYANKNNFCM